MRGAPIEADGALRGHVLPRGVSPSGSTTLDQGGGVTIAAPTFDAANTEALFSSLRSAGADLRERPMAERIEALGRAGERLQTPGDPARSEALRLLPSHACLSSAGAADVLDSMAADWTRARLRALVEHEFGEVVPENRFGPLVPDPGGRATRRIAVAPSLNLTICSGTVPGVSVTAAIRSLLVGSGTLLKPGAGDVVLPIVFARVLREVDPDLAAALAVVYWRGGDSELEDRALAEADRIVVYGGGDTLRSVRARASTSATLVEYRHRVGVAVVGVAGKPLPELDALAEQVTDAVVPYEQRGCVSPVRIHAVGSEEEASIFGERLARALERRAHWVPGARTPEEAAAAHQLVGALELRKAAGEAVELWSSPGWTVAVEASGEAFGGGRVVLVSGVPSVAGLQRELAALRGRLQVVGVGGVADEEAEQRIALWAAQAGASRIGPLHGVAYPPPWWVHEGMGPLTALIGWSEWTR